jgi:hypothetical protein
LAAWIDHLFDIIAPLQDPVYEGLTGFVDSTAVGNSPRYSMDSTATGFDVCYTLNISPAVYAIEEYNRITFLAFLAQIAALSAAIVKIIGFIFMFSEFFCMKMVHRYRKDKDGQIEMGVVEEMSDVDKIKRNVDELMLWKDFQGRNESQLQNVPVVITENPIDDNFNNSRENSEENSRESSDPVDEEVHEHHAEAQHEGSQRETALAPPSGHEEYIVPIPPPSEHEEVTQDNHVDPTSNQMSHPIDSILGSGFLGSQDDHQSFKQIETPQPGSGYTPSPSPDTRLDEVLDQETQDEMQ